jgi:hypothetical protein
MITASLIRSSWIVSTTLQETTREWPRLGSAAQILIASIPVVAVALLAVLTFFFILWDYKKHRVLIERGITPKPRNIDDKLLLIGIVSLFVGIGLLVFFGLKTGLSNSLLGGIIPTASGMGIVTYYILIQQVKKKRERGKSQ